MTPPSRSGGGDDVSFAEAFEASDAERRTSSVPDAMPMEYVRRRARKIEKILRLQFKPDPLPQHMQAKLATCPLDGSDEDAVERWVTVSHLLRCVRDGIDRPPRGTEMSSEEAEEAARKLLQREPVEVELSERRVEVTGRSYAAMLQMARHETRIEDLRQDADRATELRDRLQSEIQDADRGSARRRRLKRRRERVGRIHRVLLQEMSLHRRALYAHALTEDGGPASGLEDAPDWWREIGPAEHVAILAGLLRAGPGRLNELGTIPDRGDEGRGFQEDWGYKSLIASFEGEMNVEPASYFNRDLGQMIAWMRGSAREPFDADDE